MQAVPRSFFWGILIQLCPVHYGLIYILPFSCYLSKFDMLIWSASFWVYSLFLLLSNTETRRGKIRTRKGIVSAITVLIKDLFMNGFYSRHVPQYEDPPFYHCESRTHCCRSIISPTFKSRVPAYGLAVMSWGNNRKTTLTMNLKVCSCQMSWHN